MTDSVKCSDSGHAEGKAKVRSAVELYTLQIAEEAVEQSKKGKESGDLKEEMLSAMTAVVFAQITFEGFFHALLEQELKTKGRECEYKKVMAVARLDEQIEMGVCFISGKEVERGKLPFQDFELLRNIRNALVHYEPAWETSEEDDPEAILGKIRATKRFPLNEARARWEEKLFTAECAQWACQTALEIIRYVYDICGVDCPKPIMERLGGS